MPEMKILVSDGLDEEGQTILRRAAQVDDCKGITKEELVQVIGSYHGIILRSRTRLSAEVLREAALLRVIGRAGVGVDNIDLAAANQRGITVVNAPQSTSIAVAEMTLGLMLALARSIPQADAAMKSGQWIKSQLQGGELNGKILGLVGVGNIGSAVGQRAAAFGMVVLGYDPFLPDEEISRRGAQPVALAELYRQADFISLHVPLTPDTRNMVSGQTLAQMKRGVRLICTARGNLIDETALLGGLESGQVGGAALDVFLHEPPGLTGLVSHARVITTPHISAQTNEAQRRASVDIAQEVLAVLRGDPLRWKVV